MSTYEISVSGATEWSIDSTSPGSGKVTDLKVVNSQTRNFQDATFSVFDITGEFEVGDTVNVTIDGSNEFSGYVNRVEEETYGVNKYNIQCIGKTYDLYRDIVDNDDHCSYSSMSTSDMVRDMVEHNSNYVDYEDVPVGSGPTLQGTYNWKNYILGDAIRTLTDYDGYHFYVASDGDLQYYENAGTQALTVTESDLLSHSPFQYSDDELYNYCLVIGKAKDSGTSNYSATSQNATSISDYGVHIKRIIDRRIESDSDAQAIANTVISGYSEPALYGNVTITGNTNIDISQKFTLYLENMGISSECDIMGYTHSIDKRGFTTQINFGREPFSIAQQMAMILDKAKDAEENSKDVWDNIIYQSGMVDGYVQTFYQDEAPGPSGVQLGDLWFDTDDGNKLYRANTDEPTYISPSSTTDGWDVCKDSGIAEAFASATTAMALADGKVFTFAQGSTTDGIPVASGVGDLWFDTDSGNRMYRAEASGADEVVNGEWVLARDEDISTALNTAISAQSTADEKIVSFFQDYNPTISASVDEGDIWFHTGSGNKAFVYSGSSWVDAQDTQIDDAIGAATDAQDTADSKVITFYQDDTPIPVASGVGDLWVNTASGNKLYRAYTSGADAYGPTEWVDVQDESIANSLQAAQYASGAVDGKIQSFYQTSAPGPSNVYQGDLWFDTNDGNKCYRADVDEPESWEWSTVQDTGIQDAMLSANAAQTTADGKITTYYQNGIPTAEGEGDLWIETDNDDKLFRAYASGVNWKGSTGWYEVTHGDFTADVPQGWGWITGSKPDQDADNTEENISGCVWYGSSAPSSPYEGFLWCDTDDNTFYRYNGSSWQDVSDITADNGQGWSWITGSKPEQDADNTADNGQYWSWIEGSKPEQDADNTHDNSQYWSWIAGSKPEQDADNTNDNPQSYSWVTGTKPPTNADNTANNGQGYGWLTNNAPHSWLNDSPEEAHHPSVVKGGYAIAPSPTSVNGPYDEDTIWMIDIYFRPKDDRDVRVECYFKHREYGDTLWDLPNIFRWREWAEANGIDDRDHRFICPFFVQAGWEWTVQFTETTNLNHYGAVGWGGKLRTQS